MKAVLNANVFYPATLRSLLIDLAILKAYEAHWTDLIQEEWQRNLLRNRPESQVEELMNKALLTALFLAIKQQVKASTCLILTTCMWWLRLSPQAQNSL